MNAHYSKLMLVICMSGLAACSSPQDKAAEAEAEYSQEKTKTLQDYKKCVKDAGDDEKDLKQCESLLKAVEAVEGTGSKTDK